MDDSEICRCLQLLSLRSLIADRSYRLTTYPLCFVGSEFVTALLGAGFCESREEGILKGREMVRRRVIRHVTSEHDFEDGMLFYRPYDLDSLDYLIRQVCNL